MGSIFDDSTHDESRYSANEQHRRAEREHWRMERAAWRFQKIVDGLACFFSLFAAVVALTAAIYAGGAYHEAKKQADAAVDESENMDRPWIKLVDLLRPHIRFVDPSVARPFGYLGEMPWVSFNVTPRIRNVGRTTATHVHVQAKLVIHKWANEWADFSLEQAETCSTVERMERGYDATLFPDDPFDGFGVGSTVFLSQDNVSTIGEDKYIAAAIVGCIDYQFAPSRRHHQTRFIYEMVRTDNGSRIFVVGQDATEHEITLIRDPQSDYAD